MVAKAAIFSALSLFCLVPSVQAATDELFTKDADRIRQIAFEAALDQYPDIRADALLERENFVIWCMSALKLGLVSDIWEDFDYCHASVPFEVEGTRNTRKYLDDDGFCYVETETESVKVKVFSDGSAVADPIGFGSGRHREECTEEFEGWLK